MRSCEEILKDAHYKSLTLANLFEMVTHPAQVNVPFKGTGYYLASFRHPTGWFDYGRGATIEAALEDAFQRAKGLKGVENRPIPKDEAPKEEPEIDLDDCI